MLATSSQNVALLRTVMQIELLLAFFYIPSPIYYALSTIIFELSGNTPNRPLKLNVSLGQRSLLLRLLLALLPL